MCLANSRKPLPTLMLRAEESIPIKMLEISAPEEAEK